MLTDDSLHGRAVLTLDGVKLGELEHLLLEPPALRVAALQVRVPRDVAEKLGLPHGLLRGTTLQIPVEQLQSVGDVVLLAVQTDALRRTEPTEAQPAVEPSAHA